jgi:hypothetical protein
MARTALTRAARLTGTNDPEPKRRLLTAGPLSVLFDNGALRYIRYNGAEVLRGISYLVRDRNWSTYSPAIRGLAIRQGHDRFAVRYSAICNDQQQAIGYEVEIAGGADGRLAFLSTATPLSEFLTNRTGFVVLHPLAGVVGETMEILHTDGKKRRGRFPKFISPGQPVFDIRAMTHTVSPGVTATVLMEGNKFEMEDHRNWMDASYKTYVCSLLDPWPYTLTKGQPFKQSITVTISGKSSRRKAPDSKPGVHVTLGKQSGRMPLIGVGVPMAEAAHAIEKAHLITKLNVDHLICQIDGRKGGQRLAAKAFRDLRDRTGTRSTLEVILPAKVTAQKEVSAIASELAAARYVPDAIVITHAHDLKSFQPGADRPWGPSYSKMAAAVRKLFPGTPVGGGMLSYFTELNRKPVPRDLFDFVTHTVCPIVHAADDVSVMETLQSIPSIAASVRKMIGKQAYHLGPSAIACRANPYGVGAASNPSNARICLSDHDPRQRGLFAAAWNLGLVAAFAKAGLTSLALGSVTGSQGVIHREFGTAVPWYRTKKDTVYPVYHVLAGLAAASGNRQHHAVSSEPESIAALAYKTAGGMEVWIANLTSQSRSIQLTDLAGPAYIHALTEHSFHDLATDPGFLFGPGEKIRQLSKIELGPYAVARIRAS